MERKPTLALIPSAYKAGKVYSVLPADGVGDFDFSRSGQATRVNKDGLIETVGGNTPRLNYPMIDGVVSGCPSLLLEPSRTNKIPTSNDFNGSGWNITDLTATANQVISPDGTLNASKLLMTGSGALRNELEAFFNDGYAYSIFVKKGNSRYVTIRSAFFTQSIVVGFDLDTLTAETNGKIEDYGNDWYRLSITKNISGDADKSGFFYLYLPNSFGSQISVSGNYVYAYGGQIEDGSYATSYIPTNGGTVTRSAETCTGSGDANTFNDSEGVLMAEIKIPNKSTTDSYPIAIFGIGAILQIYYRASSQSISFLSSVGGVQYLFHSTINPLGNHKVSLVYKQGQYSAFIDGFLMNRQNSGNVPSSGVLNTLNIGDDGSGYFYGNVKQLQYFNTALTDSELEYMTSYRSFNEMAKAQLYTIQ